MYSPKIKEQHIPTLYHLGKRKKKPMTCLVNEAIAEYLAKEENHVDEMTKVSCKKKDILTCS